MSNENLQDVEKLDFRPFTRFCMSIGAVPSSYLAGLSIEEQLLWLCSYLEKEVIPTVNNNGEAVEELQNLYVQLHDYVDNYFDNLNVQEEINNKLDEMASDGTLATIINQEIFGELNTAIATNTSDITTLYNMTNLNGLPTLFICDSYGTGATNFCTIYKDKVGLVSNQTYFKYAASGAGFTTSGESGKTFANLMDDAIAEMTTAQKNSIKQIIIGSCINDPNQSASYNSVISGINSVMGKATNNFPNATVYIAPFGYKTTQAGATARSNFCTGTLPALLNATTDYNQPVIVPFAYTWLRDNSWFNEDGLHPNETGHKVIANNLIRALQGQVNTCYPQQNIVLTVNDGASTPNTFNLTFMSNDDNVNIKNHTNLQITTITSLQAKSFNNVIATWSCNVLHPRNDNVMDIDIPIRVVANSVDYYLTATLRFLTNGNVQLCPYTPTALSSITNITLYPFQATKSMINI